MKLKELIPGLEISELRTNTEIAVTGISCDSRTTEKGDLFVAVTGFSSDGHDYISEAFAKGAVAVICQKTPECDINYIKVTDSRYALAVVSKNFFGDPASKLKLIGVTGTNGKTTVTMFIKHILETCRNEKVGLIGTNQILIGNEVIDTERTTPESYEIHKLLRKMVSAGCSFAIMEVSSHALALKRVSELIFDVAVFTNLTQDHLDFHETMEEYARTKASIFKQCLLGVVNLDDDYAQLMTENTKCRMLTYSYKTNEADIVAKDVRLLPDEIRFCALTTGRLERFGVCIPGLFTMYNALAAISCCMSLDIDLAESAEALKSIKGVKGRAEVVPFDGAFTIIIDYAHTPDALKNIISSIKETADGRVVVLFGCGGDRDRTKRPLMGKTAALYADFVIITSDNPRTENPTTITKDIVSGMGDSKTPYIIIEDRTKAIEFAIDNSQPGDTIILAGKGHETYQIVGNVKRHMDEREIIAEIFKKRKNIQ